MECPEAFTQATYVQVAREVRFDGRSLTLLDLAPSTICLAHEPGATAGHLPTGLFLDHWYDQLEGASVRPVPAVLSLLDADRAPASDSQVLLSLPRIREAGLQYQIQLVEGEIPPTSGACVLFIGSAVAPVDAEGGCINPSG